jgi:CheY-like chemotaxis protein/glutamate dehydrogenase/leucine dehydrogenase/glutathionyl-hydroquinone reductase/tetratricopeptide (TPR) repeat protein
LTLVFLATNVVLAYSTETNFWHKRKDAIQLATLPPSIPALNSALPQTHVTSLPSISPKIKNRRIQKWTKGIKNTTLKRLIEALPSSYGTVKGVTHPNDDSSVVLHIRDIHMNLEAQRNIASTIQTLLDKNMVNVVALEGAHTIINMDVFRDEAVRESIKKISDQFISQHKISGPIHAVLTSQQSVPLVMGIDDKTHYERNIAAVQDSLKQQEYLKKDLQQVKSELSDQKIRIYNPELAKFDRVYQDFVADRVSMGRYVELLSDYSRDIPHSVQTFLAAWQLETTIDFSGVEMERTILIQDLLKKMRKDQVQDMVSLTAMFRMGQMTHADFYQVIRDLCTEAKVNLNHYPRMRDYLQYVFLTDSIDGEVLNRDIRELEIEVFKKLAKSPQEKELVGESRHLDLILKLLDLSLTKVEWDEYKTLKRNHETTRPRGLAVSWSRNLLVAFESFYEEAELRDLKISENLIETIHFKNAQVTVLVTGGFHSTGIKRHLNDHSVVTFQPKITQVDTPNGADYLSVFAREKTPLDELFEGEQLFLAQPPFSLQSQISMLLSSAFQRAVPRGEPLDQISSWLEEHPNLQVTSLRRTQGILQVHAQVKDENENWKPVLFNIGEDGIQEVKSIPDGNDPESKEEGNAITLEKKDSHRNWIRNGGKFELLMSVGLLGGAKISGLLSPLVLIPIAMSLQAGGNIFRTPPHARILLVEDNIAFAQALMDVIDSFMEVEVEVTHVENGQVALERIEQESGNYGLILSDLEMPVKGGWELYQDLQAGRHKSIPFVLLTSRSHKEVSEMTNFSDEKIISKGSRARDLVGKIERVMIQRGDSRPQGPKRGLIDPVLYGTLLFGFSVISVGFLSAGNISEGMISVGEIMGLFAVLMLVPILIGFYAIKKLLSSRRPLLNLELKPRNETARMNVDVQFKEQVVRFSEAGSYSIDISRSPQPSKLEAVNDLIESNKIGKNGIYIGNQNQFPGDRDAMVKTLGIKVMAVDKNQAGVIDGIEPIGVGIKATHRKLAEILKDHHAKGTPLPDFIVFDVLGTLIGLRPGSKEDENLLYDHPELAELLLMLAQKGVKLAFTSDTDSQKIKERVGNSLFRLAQYMKSDVPLEFTFYTSGMATKFRYLIYPKDGKLRSEIEIDDRYGENYRLYPGTVQKILSLLGNVEENPTGHMKGTGLVWDYYTNRMTILDENGLRSIHPEFKQDYPNWKVDHTIYGNVRPPKPEVRDQFLDGSATQITWYMPSRYSPENKVSPIELDDRQESLLRIVNSLTSDEGGTLSVVTNLHFGDIVVSEDGSATIAISQSPRPTKSAAMRHFLKSRGFYANEGIYIGDENQFPGNRDAMMKDVAGLLVYGVDENQQGIIPEVIPIGVGPQATQKWFEKLLEDHQNQSKPLPTFIGLDIDKTLLGTVSSHGRDETLDQDQPGMLAILVKLIRNGVHFSIFTDNDYEKATNRVAMPLVRAFEAQEIKIPFNIDFYTNGMASHFMFQYEPDKGPTDQKDREYTDAYGLSADAVQTIKNVMGDVTEDEDGNVIATGIAGDYYFNRYTISGPQGRRIINPRLVENYPHWKLRYSPSGNVQIHPVEVRRPSNDGSAAQLVWALPSRYYMLDGIKLDMSERRRMVMNIAAVLGDPNAISEYASKVFETTRQFRWRDLISVNSVFSLSLLKNSWWRYHNLLIVGLIAAIPFFSENQFFLLTAVTASGFFSRIVDWKSLFSQAAYEEGLAIDLVQELLPKDAPLSRSEIRKLILPPSNFGDKRRYDYTRRGKNVVLPPTVVLSGEVATFVEEKPRFVVITFDPQKNPRYVIINVIYSDTENENFILAKGGNRFYFVGQKNEGEVLESMQQKFKGSDKFDPILPEAQGLSLGMFGKSPMWDVFHDGGKAVLLFDETRKDDDPPLTKETVIRNWVASSVLAGILGQIYLAGPDSQMSQEEMEIIESEGRRAWKKFGKPKREWRGRHKPTRRILFTSSRPADKYATFPHEELRATSIGVVELLLTVINDKEILEERGMDPNHPTVSIAGVGDVGGGVLRWLKEQHPEDFERIKLIAMSDSKGTILNRDGLDKELILKLLTERDNMMRVNAAKGRRGFNLREFYARDGGVVETEENTPPTHFAGADIHIPAAIGTQVKTIDAINHMKEAGTKMIFLGQNLFADQSLLDQFEPEIMFWDNRLCSGGGIYCSKEEVVHILWEGERDIQKHKKDRYLHVQGDIADNAIAIGRWILSYKKAHPEMTISQIREEISKKISKQKAAILDEIESKPDRIDTLEVQRRTNIDIARGFPRNAEVKRVLMILNASEYARGLMFKFFSNPKQIMADLKSRDYFIKRSAVYWAGKLRMREAVDLILKILKNPKEDVQLRRLAAVSLGYIGDEKAETVLKELHESHKAYKSHERERNIYVGAEWALKMLAGTNHVVNNKLARQAKKSIKAHKNLGVMGLFLFVVLYAVIFEMGPSKFLVSSLGTLILFSGVLLPTHRRDPTPIQIIAKIYQMLKDEKGYRGLPPTVEEMVDVIHANYSKQMADELIPWVGIARRHHPWEFWYLPTELSGAAPQFLNVLSNIIVAIEPIHDFDDTIMDRVIKSVGMSFEDAVNIFRQNEDNLEAVAVALYQRHGYVFMGIIRNFIKRHDLRETVNFIDTLDHNISIIWRNLIILKRVSPDLNSKKTNVIAIIKRRLINIERTIQHYPEKSVPNELRDLIDQLKKFHLGPIIPLSLKEADGEDQTERGPPVNQEPPLQKSLAISPSSLSHSKKSIINFNDHLQRLSKSLFATLDLYHQWLRQLENGAARNKQPHIYEKLNSMGIRIWANYHLLSQVVNEAGAQDGSQIKIFQKIMRNKGYLEPNGSADRVDQFMRQLPHFDMEKAQSHMVPLDQLPVPWALDGLDKSHLTLSELLKASRLDQVPESRVVLNIFIGEGLLESSFEGIPIEKAKKIIFWLSSLAQVNYSPKQLVPHFKKIDSKLRGSESQIKSINRMIRIFSNRHGSKTRHLGRNGTKIPRLLALYVLLVKEAESQTNLSHASTPQKSGSTSIRVFKMIAGPLLIFSSLVSETVAQGVGVPQRTLPPTGHPVQFQNRPLSDWRGANSVQPQGIKRAKTGSYLYSGPELTPSFHYLNPAHGYTGRDPYARYLDAYFGSLYGYTPIAPGTDAMKIFPFQEPIIKQQRPSIQIPHLINPRPRIKQPPMKILDVNPIPEYVPLPIPLEEDHHGKELRRQRAKPNNIIDKFLKGELGAPVNKFQKTPPQPRRRFDRNRRGGTDLEWIMIMASMGVMVGSILIIVSMNFDAVGKIINNPLWIFVLTVGSMGFPLAMARRRKKGEKSTHAGKRRQSFWDSDEQIKEKEVSKLIWDGHRSFERKEYREAESSLTRAIEVSKGDIRRLVALNALAIVYLEWEKFDEALDTIQRGQKLLFILEKFSQSQSSRSKTTLPKQRKINYTTYAVILYQMDHLDKAIEMLSPDKGSTLHSFLQGDEKAGELLARIKKSLTARAHSRDSFYRILRDLGLTELNLGVGDQRLKTALQKSPVLNDNTVDMIFVDMSLDDNLNELVASVHPNRPTVFVAQTNALAVALGARAYAPNVAIVDASKINVYKEGHFSLLRLERYFLGTGFLYPSVKRVMDNQQGINVTVSQDFPALSFDGLSPSSIFRRPSTIYVLMAFQIPPLEQNLKSLWEALIAA